MKAGILYLLVAALILISNLSSLAQTEKGTKLVGGGGYFTIEKDFVSVGISPDIGLFVKDNFVLGASLPLYFQRDSDLDLYTSQRIGLSPFARYYFGEGSTRLFALASLGYSHGWWQHNPENRKSYSSSSGYGTGSAGIGLVHFLTNQIGVEARATYNGHIPRDQYSGRFMLGFGFQIYLPSVK